MANICLIYSNFWQKIFENGNIDFSLQNGKFLAIFIS